ncbi:MAG: hypothetical protein JNM57_07955 [Cyclobacteriaceae bacterium]|nr:hypothetical protein [Cyclobacteriaceae bacterium]
MDIQKTLLQEHSKRQAGKVVDYVGNNPARFNTLIQVFLNGPYRVTQRAAWPLSICVEHYPALIVPHLSIVLKQLERTDVHDAVKRNIVRLLQFIDVPKRHRGKVAALCFGFLQQRHEPIAVRAFSMTVLAHIVRHEPALKTELQIVLEDMLPYGSPGLVSRASKVLREIKSL